MADRGMVTEAIEKCLNFDDACNDCLYEGCVFKYGSCTKDLLADALVLLKGKEPIFPEIKQDCCGIVYVCGACGATLYKIHDTASAEYKIQHVRFCPECGREVKIARNDVLTKKG